MDERFGLKIHCIENIVAVLSLQKEVEEAIIFGSRAMGTYKNGSDIDIALKGENITFNTISSICTRLDELPYLYTYDVIDYKKINNPALTAHIDELGITFYQKKQMPSEWKTYKLGEVAEVQTGPFGSQLHAYDYQKEGIPVIMPTNIGDNKVIEDDIARISVEMAQSLSRHYTFEGDIVYSRRGDIERKAYISKHEHGWICGTGCLKVRPNAGVIHPKFLSYALGAEKVREYFRTNAVGSTMLSLNTGILNATEITAPSLATQQQIAQILSSLDDKIALNLQMNQTLEAMAQAIFKEWFVNFNFPSFDGELVDGLPKGWRRCQIKDVCEVNTSTLSSKDSIREIYYIEISEVERGAIKNIAVYKKGEEPSRAKRKLKHGDTVLSTVRPNRGSYFLSIHPKENLIASTGFAVFSPTKVPFSFLYIFLTNDDQLEFYGKMADGAAYPAINQSVIMNMEIFLPTKELLEIYQDISGNLLIRIFENLEANRVLTQLRDTLLPRLMSGQLTVGP